MSKMDGYLTHKFVDFIFSTQNLRRLSESLLGIKESMRNVGWILKCWELGELLMGYGGIKLVVGLLENLDYIFF